MDARVHVVASMCVPERQEYARPFQAGNPDGSTGTALP